MNFRSKQSKWKHRLQKQQLYAWLFGIRNFYNTYLLGFSFRLHGMHTVIYIYSTAAATTYAQYVCHKEMLDKNRNDRVFSHTHTHTAIAAPRPWLVVVCWILYARTPIHSFLVIFLPAQLLVIIKFYVFFSLCFVFVVLLFIFSSTWHFWQPKYLHFCHFHYVLLHCSALLRFVFGAHFFFLFGPLSCDSFFIFGSVSVFE